MARHFLQLEGFIRALPPAALAALRGAMDESGACILDAHAFSNQAMSFSFEMDAGRLAHLRQSLERAGVVLYGSAVPALARLAGSEGEMMGQILLTLVHDQPDEPGVVPAVPG